MDEKGEQLKGQICSQLAEYMSENGLVKINGENCHLDLKSEHICKSGWIEHLKSENNLPKNTDLSFDATTLENLERLKNGQTITLTKDSHKESSTLIRNLGNLGILHKPTRFGYACDLKNRKYLTKLIELKSWEKFLEWSENDNSKSDFINDFSGSTIAQVNQSESLNVEKTEIKQTNHPKTKEKQQNAITSFIVKFWWQILIPLAIGIILIMIEKGIIDIGI
ncbi:hypothetical protein [Maribacter sp. R86514]|uniref:hypothetical protein n=1 Tax=Maribacter sp. R86514 TaxID=3093854 RepID=UPI0037CCB891